MKKLLLTMLAVSFAGLAYSDQAYLSCAYNDKTIATQLAVTGTTMTNAGINFFQISNDMSFDPANLACGSAKITKDQLLGLTANLGNLNYILALPKTVSNFNDWSGYLDTYLGGLLYSNLTLRILPKMLNNQTRFDQYKKDFIREDLSITLVNKTTMLHGKKANDNSIFKGTSPENYSKAQEGLNNYLTTAGISINGATIISEFITRYDSQGGLFSIPDLLQKFGMLPTGGIVRGDTVADLDVSIEKENNNSVSGHLTFFKNYTGYSLGGKMVDSPAHIKMQIPFTVSMTANGKLTMTLGNKILSSYTVGSSDYNMKALVFNSLLGYIPAAVNSNTDIWK